MNKVKSSFMTTLGRNIIKTGGFVGFLAAVYGTAYLGSMLAIDLAPGAELGRAIGAAIGLAFPIAAKSVSKTFAIPSITEMFLEKYESMISKDKKEILEGKLEQGKGLVLNNEIMVANDILNNQLGLTVSMGEPGIDGIKSRKESIEAEVIEEVIELFEEGEGA